MAYQYKMVGPVPINDRDPSPPPETNEETIFRFFFLRYGRFLTENLSSILTIIPSIRPSANKKAPLFKLLVL